MVLITSVPDLCILFTFSCHSMPRASEKKSHRLMMGEMLLALWLTPSFLIVHVSSLFLQVTRITIKAWMSSNFSRIAPLTVELADLECLKNQRIILLVL